MTSQASGFDSLTGFEEARYALQRHDSRQHVLYKLNESGLLADPQVHRVHVDHTSRLDRAQLTGFDREGRRVASVVAYNDENKILADCPDFQDTYGIQQANAGSDLAAASVDGWLIDITALAAYDPEADTRKTQRAMVLAHLRDMVGSGEASCLIFGEEPYASTATPETVSSTKANRKH